jgi:hypothetical protein
MNIVEAMNHPSVFEPWFRGQSWDGWRAVLKAAYALPMSDAEQAFFRSVADRDPPTKPVRELWIQAGRRSGKDSIASLIAAYAGALFNQQDRLRRGERALVACLGCDRDQSRIVLNYTRSYFEDIPSLKAMVTRETASGFELDNRVDIAITTNNFKSNRGRPLKLAILDECAFYPTENSASPDEELYRALMPGFATLPKSMLIGISSPYRRAGLLYRKFKDHYGRDGDVLVIKAPSLTLNPTLDPSIIAEALASDPSAARAEWLAEPRDDIETFISREAIDALVMPGRRELPPISGIHYVSAIDPAGGSGGDSMTMAVAFRDRDGRAVLAAVRERRPKFSPEDVVSEFVQLAKCFNIRKCVGDRWGGEFVREPFRKHGIEYVLAEQPKSDFYRDCLPLLNSGKVELLDHPRLISQLCSLEQRTARSGKTSIDHPPHAGAHDDVSNVAAMALVLAANNARRPMRISNAVLAAASNPATFQPHRQGVFFGGR